MLIIFVLHKYIFAADRSRRMIEPLKLSTRLHAKGVSSLNDYIDLEV